MARAGLTKPKTIFKLNSNLVATKGRLKLKVNFKRFRFISPRRRRRRRRRQWQQIKRSLAYSKVGAPKRWAAEKGRGGLGMGIWVWERDPKGAQACEHARNHLSKASTGSTSCSEPPKCRKENVIITQKLKSSNMVKKKVPYWKLLNLHLNVLQNCW